MSKDVSVLAGQSHVPDSLLLTWLLTHVAASRMIRVDAVLRTFCSLPSTHGYTAQEQQRYLAALGMNILVCLTIDRGLSCNLQTMLSM